MANTQQTAVLLILDRTARPIQGHIAIDGRSAVRFHGWLECNDRLEQALSPTANNSNATETSQ